MSLFKRWPARLAILYNVRQHTVYIHQAMQLIWEAARGWTLAWIILLVLQGLLPVALVYLTRALVDHLVAVIGTQGTWEQIRPLLISSFLLASVILLTDVLQSALAWIRTAQSEQLQDHISALIHAQSVAVDLAFYETPDYYDQLHRARSDASNRTLALLENGGSVVQHSITLAAMAAVLLPYGSWLPLVLVAGALPALAVVLRFNRRYHRWWEQTTPERRWAQYYDMVLTHSSYAAEMRLFDLGRHFQSAFQTVRRQLRTERLRLIKSENVARLGAGASALLITGATMGWMVWQGIQGRVTLGDLVLFYQALQRGQNLMRTLLSHIGQLYTNTLFLRDLFTFLGLQPRVVDPQQPLPMAATWHDGIRFHQVTFRYPGSTRTALQDFNLTIPAGKIVAIVGANGAGKSTLVKLLCRFYDPEAGHVTIDGVDLRSIASADLRRAITVIFQHPVAYLATAGQNIALGALHQAPGPEALETAARAGGAHEVIAQLPQGYETLLGKWFVGGSELSAGEWQRIALARAFARPASLVILDEPTSLMDSWTEAGWGRDLRTHVHGQTTLIITHRFTTAMCADVIHVMQQGRIVESGSHDALLAQGGLYAQSWTAQMQVGSDPTYVPSESNGREGPQSSPDKRVERQRRLKPS